jgi:hypothetical protein
MQPVQLLHSQSPSNPKLQAEGLLQIAIIPAGGGLPAKPPEQGVEPPLSGEQREISKYVAELS